MLLKEFPRESVGRLPFYRGTVAQSQRELAYNSAGSVRYEHASILSAMGGAVVAAPPVSKER